MVLRYIEENAEQRSLAVLSSWAVANMPGKLHKYLVQNLEFLFTDISNKNLKKIAPHHI